MNNNTVYPRELTIGDRFSIESNGTIFTVAELWLHGRDDDTTGNTTVMTPDRLGLILLNDRKVHKVTE